MENFTYMPKTRKEAKSIGSKYYYTGSMCKNMHFDKRLASTFRCVSCNRQWAAVKRRVDPEYLEKQRSISRTRNLERYHEDAGFRSSRLEYAKKRNRERWRDDPEFREMRNNLRRRYLENPENREKVRSATRRNRRKRMKKEEYIVYESWRTLLKRSVKAGYSKEHPTIEILGYTPAELRAHMESLFEDGMSWDNHGAWHIDHRRPMSSFPIDTPPSVVHSLNNLQPLWAADNIRKGHSYDE